MRERCLTPSEVRLDGDGDRPSKLVGYAARYYDGTPETEYKLWTGAVERIAPGAFDRAAAEDDVRALVNHDSSLILGRTVAGTLELVSNEAGLAYEINLPDTTVGRDIATSVGRGDISGSSFQFEVTDETWSREDGLEVRTIQGVGLFDVGPVTFPAYQATSVDAREARERWDARQAQRAAERQARIKRFEARLRLRELDARTLELL